MMPMKRTVLKGLLAVLLHLCLLENNLVRARPTGAPVESYPEICNTLTPGHGIPASVSESPYSIIVANETYKPGVDFTVTINTDSGSPGLKGIFLQMHEAVTHEIIGSWSVMDSGNFKTVSCNEQNDSAVTHQNSVVKPSTNTFTWTPPDMGGPDIYVAATFVQTHQTFWVNVTSLIIPDDPCSGNACMNGATCVPDADGGNYTCTCSDGFAGPMCNLDDPCIDNMCMNGTTCVPDADGGNYTCTCPEGFTGPMCNLEVDPCLSNECSNNATCVPGTGEIMYTCTCAEGFTGALCDVEEGGDAVTTPAATTAQGSILTYNFQLAVSALWLVVIINKVILA
ncbi:delta-like protein B [Strongylocentrotus purpuratus]|uniref:Uncharacterized protein n=1 Tax=Strongylocentrotus purpuratus TaxID=7668 RepID=A0A7M7PBU8_STRPU|nr:delta-like protein B [Strongylocentrotus purpuratus]